MLKECETLNFGVTLDSHRSLRKEKGRPSLRKASWYIGTYLGLLAEKGQRLLNYIERERRMYKSQYTQYK